LSSKTLKPFMLDLGLPLHLYINGPKGILRKEKDMRDVVIVSACRTPIGDFGGSLSTVSATDLGALVINEAISRAGISKEDVDEVIMGCVLPHGLRIPPGNQWFGPVCRGTWEP